MAGKLAWTRAELVRMGKGPFVQFKALGGAAGHGADGARDRKKKPQGGRLDRKS